MIPDTIDAFDHVANEDGKNVFFFWDTPENIPAAYTQNIQRIADMMPGWSVQLVGDTIINALLARHEPDIHQIYDDIRVPACRSDIARQLLLAHYGGWYLDSDMQCAGPLTDFPMDRPILIRRDDTEAMCARFRVINGIMYIPKGHKLPARVLRGINRNLSRPALLHDVLGFAGPKLLSRVAQQYKEEHLNILLASEYLYTDDGFFTELTTSTSFSWRIQQPFGILDTPEPAWKTFPHRLRKVHLKALQSYLEKYDLYHHLPKLAEMRPRFMENETFKQMVKDYQANQ